MNKKPLIILLVIIIMAMSFLIWFKNSEDINNQLSNGTPIQNNSGEELSQESTGGIDINLSGDEPIITGKENSGDVNSSVDTPNTPDNKEPIVEPITPPVTSTEKEENSEDNQSGEENNIEAPSTTPEENNPVLVSDDTKIVFKMGATQITVYYFNGETITKKEAYIDYKTEAEAKKVAEQYNNGTKNLSDIGDIKTASSAGKYVVMTFNEAEFEHLTVTKLKMMYGKYEIKK